MKKRLLSLLLALVMVLGMLPVGVLAADAPVSVTGDGEAVTVSYQGDFYDTQWGYSAIPVYYAQVAEDATITITCDSNAEATYRGADQYLGYLSDLQGMTKQSLQPYFVTASSYGLTTTNNVAYIEILDYYYGSIYGVLIELVPASSGNTDSVPLISVTVGNEARELTTLGTYESSIRYKTDMIPVYMVSANEGETIVVSKGANGDGASLSYRRLWKYGASSSDYTEVNNSGITVPVTSTYAINSNADAMAKFDLTTSNTVYYVEIGTSSEGTPLYGLLVEVIPAAPAAAYTVTLPSGEGYVATASGDSASSVEEGGSYSFTVAVIYGYDGTNMVVKANDTVLTAVNGVYTIENIRADQNITVTGVTKAVQTDYSDYITVSVEKYDANGNCTFLLEPTQNIYDQYVNKYVIDALKLAVGGSQYSDKVGYSSTYENGVSTYFITKVYDQTQSDSYLDNGDLEGYKWQVLVDNEPWEGSYYNKNYALTGGEVLRCIYTNEAIENVAGGVSKDALIQLAADVSDEIKATQAYQDALDTIVSDTASDTDVQNAITALQNAKVVKATSVQITAGENVDLKVNSSLTLQVAILPANATDVPVWSTSDSGIVSVDAASGQITGVSAGTATVTVTCGSATDTITVNVEAVKAESITIDNGDVSVEARFSVQLVATVTPEGSTELVEWSVADESIATVDTNGKLTGVSAGTTTVTASAGSVSDTVTVTVTDTTSTYVYFKYSNGDVQEMKDDSFTLTVLDEGYFVVGNTTAAATWSCSEYVSAGGNEMQYNYWIGSDGKYQPHGVKDMTAYVNAGGYYKTFTIKTVSSGISQIKAYISRAEKNAESPYETTGTVAGIPIEVRGLNANNQWVYIPTQALTITSSDTNIARILGNQMSLIHEGSATISVSMLDNSEVSTSFQAICNTVQVTDIDVVVPEIFYIDKWDSMGGVFVGIYMGYDNPDTQYHVYYTPSNATNQDLIWEDLTPEIAEYDEGWSTGIVPKKAGTAKFKVTSVSNPEVSQEVTIKFAYKTPLESASAKASYEMNVGESLDPGLIFTPTNATETRFNWTYSQDGIVEVKETVTSAGYDRVVNRKIIAKASGTVTVTGTPIDNTAGCGNVVFTVTVGSSGETETIDYLKMAKEDIAHGLEYLEGRPQDCYGCEWTIFTNLRAGGSMDPQMRIIYLKDVENVLNDSSVNKQPTDYVRLILTLPLLEVDPENFEGINLVEKLYNNPTLGSLTSNQICWTLLALDSRKYDIPEDALWNRDALIEKILTFQNSDGSFALDPGGSGDVDMTGMILQSLAPYYNSSYPEVQSAVNKALAYLKAAMNENVGYIVGGAENVCTAAQVLTALAALNIDPTDSDNGFTLGTKNLITNLRSFKQDSGFAYLLGDDTNMMGTQQTTYALEAYRRYAEGENFLYDLTDVAGQAGSGSGSGGSGTGGEEDKPQIADPVDVFVTISNAGNVVAAQQSVTVKDINENGKIDVDDTLYATHEKFYTGGAAAGYGSGYSSWGLSVTKLWGDTSGAFGYWLNHASCSGLEDEVKEGDYLVAFVYQDQTNWGDTYSKFDKLTYTATAENALTVSLTKAAFDASWQMSFVAVTGATITAYDENGKALAADAYTVTDNGDGTYSVVFDAAGTYQLIATDATPIVPAVSTVTVSAKVTEPQNPTDPSTPGSSTETPKTGDDTNIAFFVITMLGSVTCLAALLLISKKKYAVKNGK